MPEMTDEIVTNDRAMLREVFLHLARLQMHTSCWTVQKFTGDVDMDATIAMQRAEYLENAEEWLRQYAMRDDN